MMPEGQRERSDPARPAEPPEQERPEADLPAQPEPPESPERPDRIVPDLIVLAGGRGSRLGGAAKPSVAVAGRTLLSRALDARALAARTVVVGPESSRAAAGAAAGDLIWTLEDPPLGGPVAGVAAGLAALERAAAARPVTEPTAEPAPEPDARPTTWVLLLACDLPWAADAARVLLSAADALADSAQAGRPAAGPGAAADPLGAVDGIHLVDADGRAQWLTGLYRASALRAAVGRAGAEVRGASMRGLLAGLTLRGIRDDSSAGRDVDTWQDVAETEAMLDPSADSPPAAAGGKPLAAAD